MACARWTIILLKEEDTNTCCVSCIKHGYLKTAEIYCVYCGRYLCKRCAGYPQRSESSKNQEGFNKEQERDILTSSDVLDDKPDECVERCVTHVKQVMEYYCENHQKLCCTACIMLEHTYCSKKYIPTASENIFKSQVYREFKAEIQSFIKGSHDNQKKLDKTLELTRKEASDKLDDIRRQRQAMNAYFDKIEEDLKRECRQAHTDNENHLDEVIKLNKNLLVDLYKMNVEMTTKEQKVQQCQVYVKLKQWHDLPKQYSQRMADISAAGRVHHYRFEPSDDYFKKQDSTYFGHFVLQPEHVIVKHDRETTCDIRELAILPNGTVALADYENDFIKVMHPSRLQVTPELMYHTIGPVGLAKSSVNQFAVSTYNGRVEAIGVSASKITSVYELYRPTNFFKLIGHSLCYTNTGLVMAGGFKTFPMSNTFEYVSGDSSSTLLMPWEMFDNLVDNHTRSARHERFATCPRFGTIYRTLKQRRLRKLIRQNMNGDIFGTYEHKLLPSPCGVAVSSNGTVYVCDDETNTIHVLTPDLNLRRIVRVDFGGAKPRALAFCNKYELLYVCTDGNILCILRLPELS